MRRRRSLTGHNDGHEIGAALCAIRSPDRPHVLVVMNACESEGHLEGLLEVAPMAIGLAVEIGDPHAMSLSARFYTSIADGQSVVSAVDAAVVQMEMDGMDDADLPVLRARESKALIPGSSRSSSQIPVETHGASAKQE